MPMEPSSKKRKVEDGQPSNGRPCAHTGVAGGIREAAYSLLVQKNVQDWMQKLRCGELAPKAEQWRLVKAVVDRCGQEAAELASQARKKQLSEPMRAFVTGIPGAGKSKCIKWLIKFFTDCLALSWRSTCSNAVLSGVRFFCFEKRL